MMGYDCCRADIRFFFKQKTAYEMRISDWSSDVCSSDLPIPALFYRRFLVGARRAAEGFVAVREAAEAVDDVEMFLRIILEHRVVEPAEQPQRFALIAVVLAVLEGQAGELRSEEHTSELQSLMRISYAVFCMNKKTNTHH